MCEHAAGGGFAVGAGDARDGDFAWAAFREQHVHHRATDIAALPLTWGYVHTEPGCGVDFADAAAVRAVTLADVFAQEIHTADIQTDRFGGANRHRLGVRVHDIGDVNGGAAGRKICGFA